jgi:hypothetical protein
VFVSFSLLCHPIIPRIPSLTFEIRNWIGLDLRLEFEHLTTIDVVQKYRTSLAEPGQCQLQATGNHPRRHVASSRRMKGLAFAYRSSDASMKFQKEGMSPCLQFFLE